MKPDLIGLLEDFVRVQHRLGKPTEEITAAFQAAVRYWVTEEVLPSIDRGLERAALQKFGGDILDRAVARHVQQVLEE